MTAHIHDVLQLAELRTVIGSHRNIHLRCQCHGSQLLLVLIGKGHLLAHRYTAQLTEQHLRQHQSVVHLCQCHLSLVDFHIDTQSLGTGGNTLTDHFLHVTVEFLHHVKITLSQSLLMLQRYHLPIGLVYLVECQLPLCLCRVSSHFLTEVRHLVHSDDSTTHEDRLCQHHSACEHIPRISTERIDDTLTTSIQQTAELRESVADMLLYSFGGKAHIPQGSP